MYAILHIPSGECLRSRRVEGVTRLDANDFYDRPEHFVLVLDQNSLMDQLVRQGRASGTPYGDFEIDGWTKNTRDHYRVIRLEEQVFPAQMNSPGPSWSQLILDVPRSI